MWFDFLKLRILFYLLSWFDVVILWVLWWLTKNILKCLYQHELLHINDNGLKLTLWVNLVNVLDPGLSRILYQGHVTSIRRFYCGIGNNSSEDFHRICILINASNNPEYVWWLITYRNSSLGTYPLYLYAYSRYGYTSLLTNMVQ